MEPASVYRIVLSLIIGGHSVSNKLEIRRKLGGKAGNWEGKQFGGRTKNVAVL